MKKLEKLKYINEEMCKQQINVKNVFNEYTYISITIVCVLTKMYVFS